MCLTLVANYVGASIDSAPQTPGAAPAGAVESGAVQAVTPQAMLATPFAISQPERIALTPMIDGKIDAEEWDPLGVTADGSKSFFEWEPGKLHAAAVVPNGHDVVFSFDLDANGWLVGKDNLEVRLSVQSGKPVATVRLLDGTNATGPTWTVLPGFALAAAVAAVSDATSTTYELSLTDPGLDLLPADPGDRVAIRVDDPLSTDPPLEPYFPRTMTPVTFVFHRATNVPAGLHIGSEGEGKSFAVGERGRIRATFDGSNSLNLGRLELRSEGLAQMDTNLLAAPFPAFDAKGRAFIDYDTEIREQASLGFRVLKGTISTANGSTGVFETSYRVAPPADITIVRIALGPQSYDRSIEFGYYVHSNSGHRMSGNIELSVSDPIRVVNGNKQGFSIASGRGRSRQTFELFVPAGFTGTIPVHFTGDALGKPIDQMGYVTIGGL